MATGSTSAHTVSREDKIRTALDHKSRGNQAFLSNDIKLALQSYHLAVLYLSGLENRSILGLVGENSGKEGRPEDLSSDEESVGEESEKELSIVYSNMAACYLKQQNYTRAIETAEKSLKCDSKNLKAKYRKAQAMRLGGDLFRAKQFLESTIAGLKAKNNRGKKEQDALEGLETELKAVEKVISGKEGMARSKWKGFLGKNPSVFDVGGSATEQQQQQQAEGQSKGKGKAKEYSIEEAGGRP